MGDYEATIISTPGHTKGSICLYLEKEGILFSGDHIIGHITPNAFVMLESDFDIPWRMSQLEFYDSLKKIERLPRALFTPLTAYPSPTCPRPPQCTVSSFRSGRKKYLPF